MRLRATLIFHRVPVVGTLLFMLVCLWAVSAAIAMHNVKMERLQAERFLADVRQLEVGDSVDKVTRLVRKDHGEWNALDAPPLPPPSMIASIFPHTSEFSVSSPIDHKGYYRANFIFDNRWQHWLCFSPYTRFGGSVLIKENFVDSYNVGLSASHENGTIAIVLNEQHRSEPDVPFSIHQKNGLIVDLTSDAAPAQRAASYALNLECITKLRGCRTIYEMAPQLSRMTH